MGTDSVKTGAPAECDTEFSVSVFIVFKFCDAKGGFASETELKLFGGASGWLWAC